PGHHDQEVQLARTTYRRERTATTQAKATSRGQDTDATAPQQPSSFTRSGFCTPRDRGAGLTPRQWRDFRSETAGRQASVPRVARNREKYAPSPGLPHSRHGSIRASRTGQYNCSQDQSKGTQSTANRRNTGTGGVP